MIHLLYNDTLCTFKKKKTFFTIFSHLFTIFQHSNMTSDPKEDLEQSHGWGMKRFGDRQLDTQPLEAGAGVEG